jgi:hypothetical protein
MMKERNMASLERETAATPTIALAQQKSNLRAAQKPVQAASIGVRTVSF